jgi:hypothetical protein
VRIWICGGARSINTLDSQSKSRVDSRSCIVGREISYTTSK